MTTLAHDSVNSGNHNVAFAPFDANSVVTVITTACVTSDVYFLVNSMKDEETRHKTVTFASK